MTRDAVARSVIEAYLLSNRLFPQTRFYFVIDLCRRLSLDGFLRVQAEGVTLPDTTLAKLAGFGTRVHNNRKIGVSLSPYQISIDIRKMIEAVEDVFAIYSIRDGRSFCNEVEFLTDARLMKTRIDEMDLSSGYLEFVAPSNFSALQSIRSTNLYLERWLLSDLPSCALARALAPQITRPIWIRR